MPRFSDVDVFVAIAESGSLRSAAGRLAITKSTVSRALRRLESHLGARLFVRDQQALRLTDAGSAYLAHAREAVAALTQAERAVAVLAQEVVGTVCVSAPPAIGQALLSRICGEFARLHSGVDVRLILTDALVDLVGQPIDLTIRAGPRLADSDLKARLLAKAAMVAVATPSLAAELGARPTAPMVAFDYPGASGRALPDAPLPMTSRLSVNDYMSLKEAVLAGYGVGVLSQLLVARELQRGDLIRVLPQWRLPCANYWALVPGTGPLPRKTQALLEFVTERFRRAAASG